MQFLIIQEDFFLPISISLNLPISIFPNFAFEKCWCLLYTWCKPLCVVLGGCLWKTGTLSFV